MFICREIWRTSLTGRVLAIQTPSTLYSTGAYATASRH